MADISQVMLENLRKYLKNQIDSNTRISSLLKKINNGTATYLEAESFSIEVGSLLSKTFQENMTADSLPGGMIDNELAEKVVRPLLEDNREMVETVSKTVQESINKNAGIGLNAASPAPNDRIDGIVKGVEQSEDLDDQKKMLNEPVIQHAQSVVDDTIKANQEFQGKSGLAPKIVRVAVGKCCDWCRNLAGKYDYPDVPKNVFQRHAYCRCTIDFYPGNGKKKNVHSKEWSNDESDEVKERIKKLDDRNKETSPDLIESRKSIGVSSEDNEYTLRTPDNNDIIMTGKQFGKKAEKHCEDYGLDVKKQSDRNVFYSITQDIVKNCDESCTGEWRSQEGICRFYIKGNDVVVINESKNKYVTTLKGGIENARVKKARGK